MQTTSRIVMGMALLMVLFSCKKDDPPVDPPTPPPTALEVSSFSQLDPGNYWVYLRQKVDSTDAVIDGFSRVDSLFVTGDTTIDGSSYAVIHRTADGVLSPLVQYWRDSANYIVTGMHQILFSSTTFDQVIYTENTDQLHVDYSVGSGWVPVSVPAGNFDSYLVTGVSTSIGGLTAVSEWTSPRDYWVADVGRVRWYEFYVYAPVGWRYDLVHFHV